MTLTGKLENLGSQVFEDGRDVDGRLGSDPDVVGVLASEESANQLIATIEQ